MPLKAVELRSLVHYGFIKPKDTRPWFANKRYLTEPVELYKWDVYIDVSQTNHSTMQIKTACYMLEVGIKFAVTKTLPLGNSLIRKIRKHYGAFKVQNNAF